MKQVMLVLFRTAVQIGCLGLLPWVVHRIVRAI